MTNTTPIPGAAIVPFDHAAADTAIGETRTLIGRLRSVLTREAATAEEIRTDWQGASRSHFENRRGYALVEIAAAVSALESLIDEIERRRSQASLLQADANAEEMRSRARDIERLEKLAGPAA